MQTLQTQEVKETALLLQNFQVEELEERLENKWGAASTTKTCTTQITTFFDGSGKSPQTDFQTIAKSATCPTTKLCYVYNWGTHCIN